MVIKQGTPFWECSICREYKETKEFHKDACKKNGIGSYCKLCANALRRTWRAENKERNREYNATYNQTERGKRFLKKSIAKWVSNNPEKVKAHAMVLNAKKVGDLVPEPCEICGTTDDIHAHHDDYDKPLGVRWLCRTHHTEHHVKKRRADEQYILMDA